MATITRPVLIAANKELEAKVTVLEARLALATEVFRAQRAKLAEQDALLATRGCIATPTPVVKAVKPAHTVKRFTKADGSVWERHQWKGSNQAVIRQVAA